MSAEDFIRALCSEIGNPALLLTRRALLDRAIAVLPDVRLKIQQASTQAILAKVIEDKGNIEVKP